MIDQSNEAAVRARAYQLWEESGQGHGNHEDHWRRAETEHGDVASDGVVLTMDKLPGVEAEHRADGTGLHPPAPPITENSDTSKPQRKD